MEDSLREKVGKMIADRVQNGREMKSPLEAGINLNNLYWIMFPINWSGYPVP